MALVVDVPLNTMLADLDETLRVLLKRELARHGFDGVEVAFDAPARDWSSQLSGPTVNLFLYDLRESHEFRPTEWGEDRSNGRHREVRPPMIMECSYAVTAWTQAVEDEHRLLSQVLGVLFAFPQLPVDALSGRLPETAQRYAIEGKIGQPKSDGKADFWSAVGGQYKASLDYVVTLACESGVAYERGPEVRTQTMGARIADAPASTITEMHRFGGKVVDADGAAAARRLGHPAGAGAVRVVGSPGPFPAEPRPARQAQARRAHAGGRRGEGGYRRARRSTRPHGGARQARREEGQLTEWAPPDARTTAPAPLARGCPDRRSWVQMPNDDLGRTRVLLGNLEPMVRLGMIDVLAEDGIEVVGEEDRPQALVLMAGRLRPDAVVLDLLQGSSRELGDRVRNASPETKVILWARDEDAMEVLDPGATTPRRFFSAVPEEFRSELSNVRLNRVEE